MVPGGRKVKARRPRARTTAGEEAKLRTWELFASEDLRKERTVETMLAGLSTRRYETALGSCLDKDIHSTHLGGPHPPFHRKSQGGATSPSNAHDLIAVHGGG